MRQTVFTMNPDCNDPEGPSKDKMQALGNSLIETTDEVLRSIKTFISAFNQTFEFVSLANFMFEGTDYRQISVKEVSEIRAIFKQFGLEIKDLASAHSTST